MTEQTRIIVREEAVRERSWLLRRQSDEGDYLFDAPTSIAMTSAANNKARGNEDGLTYYRDRSSSLESFIRRSIDIVGSAILLIVLSPVLIFVGAAIFLMDPGPVIFRHRRMGRDGRQFSCLKFRSMYVGAETRLSEVLDTHPELRAEWEREHKLSRDPRITRIGRFLRASSLDELPQLFNVLLGEMSLVGPRPIVSAEQVKYGKHIASYYAVKPGLTGLWQVSGRNDVNYRRRVAMDVVYCRTRSVTMDLWILMATVPAVIACRGAS